MRRWVVVVGGVVTMVLVVGAVSLAGTLADSSSGDEAAPRATAGQSTVPVERRTLAEHAELDGTLGYGDLTEISLGSGGTLTAVPAAGSVINRGETLFEVNGRPVPLLFGDRPLWRELGPGVDDGLDVKQLEANLVALGIVSADQLTVDENWTSYTTAAVKEWQESLGVDESGTIAPGELVFMPDAVRIAEVPTAVGGPIGEAALQVTGTTRLVTVDLEATRQTLVEEGQAVTIVLPDGSETSGTVASVGTVASTGDEGSEGEQTDGGDTEATIEVVVSLDDPSATGSLDEAPVTVKVVTSAAEDVLAVPVEALLALAEGGYAVELVSPDGTTTLVPVELGAEADGWVQVTGDVAEGHEAVIPSG